MAGQDAVSIAKGISGQFDGFEKILWGALGQKAANPAKRSEMVAAAFDNLRTFLVKTLAAAPAEKIAKPGTATAGMKGRPMNVSAKLQADIAQTKARIEALKADSPFFALQGGGSIGPAIPAKPQPVTDATPEDVAAAIAALQENVAALLAEIEALSGQAPVTKGATDPNVGAFDGVFSRYGERRDAITKLAKDAHAARAKAAQSPQDVWRGAWTGLRYN